MRLVTYIRIRYNRLGGKLNVEDRLDGVCDPLSLALGPKAEVVVVVVTSDKCQLVCHYLQVVLLAG